MYAGTLLVVWAFLVAYDRHRRMTASHVNVSIPGSLLPCHHVASFNTQLAPDSLSIPSPIELAPRVQVMAPLFIGLAVTAAHLFLIPFTWCSINPGTLDTFVPLRPSTVYTHPAVLKGLPLFPLLCLLQLAASRRPWRFVAGAVTGSGGWLPSSAPSQVRHI